MFSCGLSPGARCPRGVVQQKKCFSFNQLNPRGSQCPTQSPSTSQPGIGSTCTMPCTGGKSAAATATAQWPGPLPRRGVNAATAHGCSCQVIGFLRPYQGRRSNGSRLALSLNGSKGCPCPPCAGGQGSINMRNARRLYGLFQAWRPRVRLFLLVILRPRKPRGTPGLLRPTIKEGHTMPIISITGTRYLTPLLAQAVSRTICCLPIGTTTVITGDCRGVDHHVATLCAKQSIPCIVIQAGSRQGSHLRARTFKVVSSSVNLIAFPASNIVPHSGTWLSVGAAVGLGMPVYVYPPLLTPGPLPRHWGISHWSMQAAFGDVFATPIVPQQNLFS